MEINKREKKDRKNRNKGEIGGREEIRNSRN